MFGGDASDNRDPNGDGGGIEVLLDEDEEPLAKDLERLVPLMFHCQQAHCQQAKREGEKHRGKVMKC
jgi:hypothetical protein